MKKEVLLDDTELLDRIRQGDKAAFSIFFQQHYKGLVGVAYKYTKDKVDAEDLAQEVFIKLWNKRTSIEIQSSVPAYLRRTTINHVLNHLAKVKRLLFTEPENWEQQAEDTSTIDLETKLSTEQQEAELHNAISQLPEKCRIVFTLNRFEGLSHKEIAEQLDISTKTIENHMTKALKLLREAMLKVSPIFFPYFFYFFFNQ